MSAIAAIPMQPFFQTISGKTHVSALFKNLGFLPIESSFDLAMALMNVSTTNSKTSLGVVRNQIFHQFLFIGAASSVKSLELGLCYLLHYYYCHFLGATCILRIIILVLV